MMIIMITTADVNDYFNNILCPPLVHPKIYFATTRNILHKYIPSNLQRNPRTDNQHKNHHYCVCKKSIRCQLFSRCPGCYSPRNEERGGNGSRQSANEGPPSAAGHAHPVDPEYTMELTKCVGYISGSSPFRNNTVWR